MQDRPKKAHSNLKQQIYCDLKDKLIHCVYPPGTVLNEMILTEEYGVSRTPVREAVSQLELDQYVTVLPKKGIYVRDLTIDDALHIFQTRIEIEPITLKLAQPYLNIEKLLEFRSRFERKEDDLEHAYELDMAMHLYLIDCCRNTYLINMMHRLFEDNTRMIIYTGQNKLKIHNARAEHIEILDSLIAMRDPEECAALMRSHVGTCRTAALQYFGKQL